MTPAARECGENWLKSRHAITDRAHRYRARQCAPPGPPRCELCGSTRFLVVDHRDADEWNDKPENLRWLCKSSNTRMGMKAARVELGRRTRQYNPGAGNLAQYVQAALAHQRGVHDAGGKIIHETPKARRREFAAEIWRRRRKRGTDR
jgi:hypothetical protein